MKGVSKTFILIHPPFILGYIAKYPRQTAWNMPRTRLRLSHRYVGEALNTDVREAGKMQKAEEGVSE